MSPENQWVGSDVFPIEIVPFKKDMLVFAGGKDQTISRGEK